jgi:REP element-mobilizing transposase RayT
MLRLASIFHIDIAAFAVMSNHYHLLVHVRRDDALKESPLSIVERAHRLVAGNDVTQRYSKNEQLASWEREQLDLFVDTWRKRLYSISTLMKFLNEGVARRANKEDECTGHFWECRFKCQALLDEKAVLSAMAYTDLNPIRAGMAAAPEASEYTSIKERVAHWKAKASTESQSEKPEDYQPYQLMRFVGHYREKMPAGLPFTLVDYIQLVDWSGRAIRDGKRGAFDEKLPPILKRLNIGEGHWLELCTHFETRFRGLVGSVATLKEVTRKLGLRRRPNYRNSKLLFN